jgi:trehalose 6-phosphate synthase
MATQQLHPAIESPLVVASNRGPVSFARDESGDPVPERGSGGLVTALAGVLFEADATWVAAAMTEVDREAAASGTALDDGTGGHMRYLDLPSDVYESYYNGIANAVLWFVHHYLWDLVQLPVFDAETRRAWDDYREVNDRFADVLAGLADPDPVFLVQDYHLSLVPRLLRERRPAARITHFSHTPFAGPTYLRILPAAMREELLRGLLGADVLGFQAEPWAENFLLAARELPGARVDTRRRRVLLDGHTTVVRVYPIALDPGPLRQAAASPEVAALRDRVREVRGDGRLLLRVDRLELSKNILRGFLAFERHLERTPEAKGHEHFLALLPPSRTAIPDYQVYAERTLEEAARINRAWGGRSWQPIEVWAEENYPLAVAAYGEYDALLVNPVFDGMNLVSMEGPLVNKRKGTLVLSRNAGSWGRLGEHALGINPFDIEETAQAIGEAFTMPPEERNRRARGLVRRVLANNPARWLTRQLRDLDVARGLGEPTQDADEPRGPVDDEIGGFDELHGGLWPPDRDRQDQHPLAPESR